MAVDATPRKVSVSMLLNNGLDEGGNVKTVTQSLPTISMAGYTGDLANSRQKVVNVITAFEDLLSKSVYDIREVQTYSLAGNE